MDKLNYSFEEIILGLRPEYLRSQHYLKLLREKTVSRNRHIKDFYFKLHKLEGKDPELICKIIQHDKKLKGRNAKLEKAIRFYMYGPEVGEVLKDNDDYFDSAKYKIHVLKEEKESFELIARHLLNSDFAKHMAMHGLLKGNSYDSLLIYLSKMIAEIRNEGRIKYDPKDDTFKINIYKPYNLQNQIIYMLKAKYPKEIFTEYHRHLIEESKNINKELIVPTIEKHYNEVELSIEKDRQTLVLKQKTN